MKKTMVLMIGLFLILALALTSCGWNAEPPQGSINATGNDETGGLDVVAQEAEEGNTVTGQVTVGEGECLMIGSAMEKGVFEVRAMPVEQKEAETDDVSSADPDATFDGSFITRLDLGAGEYLLSISVRDYVEENTTGKLTILPYQVDEIDFMNGDVPVDLLKKFGMISPNEPASGETAEFHGETAVLLEDAILTNCYSGLTDSNGRITWKTLSETTPLQQGDIVIALQESNVKTMVSVPTGDTPMALYGELSSDCLSQSIEDITQGNLADATDQAAYDQIEGKIVETLSGYVRILKRENGWCQVQPLAGGDSRVFWVQSGDLSYSFDTTIIGRTF